jgi:hypothetical protein
MNVNSFLPHLFNRRTRVPWPEAGLCRASASSGARGFLIFQQ